MSKHIKYLWYVLKHKWFVMLECFKRGLYWRGLLHDISKFSPKEWPYYVESFYGDKPIIRRDVGSYTPITHPILGKAWLHHIHNNSHHWQHHIVIDDLGGLNGNTSIGLKAFDICEEDLTEMLCDWIGAAKAQGKQPDPNGFYAKTDMWLTENSRTTLEKQLMGYKDA